VGCQKLLTGVAHERVEPRSTVTLGALLQLRVDIDRHLRVGVPDRVQWLAALNAGCENAGLDPLGDEVDVRVPFYGRLLDGLTALPDLRLGEVVPHGSSGEPDPFEAGLLLEGAVNVTAGSLELTGGGSSGEHHADSWAAAKGAKLVFNNQDFALGSSVALAGAVEVSQGIVTAGTVEGPSAVVTLNGSQWERRGTLEVNGETPSTLGTLTLNGGAVAVAGKLSVASSFLSEGTALLSGTGVLELQAGATGTVSDVTLEERTLENAGALTIGASGTIDASKSARLVNNGTLTMNAEGLGSNGGVLAAGYTATLVNTGVIQRTGGAGPGMISFAIDNDGTINADVGTLEFSGGGDSAEFTSDTWTAAPGAAIELNGISYGFEYSLGASATITGAMHLDANVNAGAIEGSGALTTLHSILKLTGFTPSELGSLTFLQAPPDVWFPQVQHLSVASELDIDNSLTWSSSSAVFEGPGAIVTKPGSATIFEAGSARFDGGQFINEGTATWQAGQLDIAPDIGTSFVNMGTFHADAPGFEPLIQGCQGLPEGRFQCAAFENYGVLEAQLPQRPEGNLPAWPHIAWDVDIDNYGRLAVPTRQEYVCPALPPYGWTSEACVAEQQHVRETYEGLLLKNGAEVVEMPITEEPEEVEAAEAEEGEGTSSTEEFIPEGGGEESNDRSDVLTNKLQPALLPAGGEDSDAYVLSTPRSPRYKKMGYDIRTGLPDGEFGNQAHFDAIPSLSWSFKLSPLRESEAVGFVKETASVYRLPSMKRVPWYSDDHEEPSWYLFHSTFPKVQLKQAYELLLELTYACESEGKAGTCRIWAGHNFKFEK
jgi:hypothetical protein